MTRRTQGSRVIAVDLGLDLVAGPAGLAAGEGGGQGVELLGGLGQGGAGEPGAPGRRAAPVSGSSTARRSVP